MKFLVLSDIHGKEENLDKLDAEFEAADAVLFAGDFVTDVSEREKALAILEKLDKKSKCLYAVTGNCDEPSFLDELEKRDVSVQGAMIFRDGLAFAGAGGGTKFTGTTPNERDEEEIMADLQMVSDRSAEYEEYTFDETDEKGEDGESEKEYDDKDFEAEETEEIEESAESVSESSGAETEEEPVHWDNLICIVHNPPKDTKVDTISAGIHVGSALYRQFIETYQPLVCVSGHIHESAAIDTIGNTTLINPGALAEGKYATLNVQKQKNTWAVIKAELKQL